MSSFWRGTSEEKLEQAERRLMEISGVQEEEYESYPVKFTFSSNDWKEQPEDDYEDEVIESSGFWWNATRRNAHVEEKTEYIWTIEMGHHNETNLVVIHGYGGSGMIFYKMFRELSEHFHVYFIDLLGMGRSSRGDFECATFGECERYFVNSIDKWRAAVGLETMNLMGHSFGGYVASRYALHHPRRLGKLLFLSPFASEVTSEEHLIKFEEKINELGFFRRNMIKLVMWMYKKNTTPFGAARLGGRLIGGFGIKLQLTRRWRTLPQEDLEPLSDYLHQILMLSGCSEYAFNIMFPNFMVTESAILNNLDEYKANRISYHFFYGSNDWMNTNFTGDYVSEQLESLGESVEIIDEWGHHVYFDNPDHTLSLILSKF